MFHIIDEFKLQLFGLRRQSIDLDLVTVFGSMNKSASYPILKPIEPISEYYIFVRIQNISKISSLKVR